MTNYRFSRLRVLGRHRTGASNLKDLFFSVCSDRFDRGRLIACDSFLSTTIHKHIHTFIYCTLMYICNIIHICWLFNIYFDKLFNGSSTQDLDDLTIQCQDMNRNYMRRISKSEVK